MCTKDGSKKGTGNNTSGGQIRHDGVGNYSERATTRITKGTASPAPGHKGGKGNGTSRN